MEIRHDGRRCRVERHRNNNGRESLNVEGFHRIGPDDDLWRCWPRIVRVRNDGTLREYTPAELQERFLRVGEGAVEDDAVVETEVYVRRRLGLWGYIVGADRLP